MHAAHTCTYELHIRASACVCVCLLQAEDLCQIKKARERQRLASVWDVAVHL